MKLVIQRVNSASVTIENKIYSSINKGLLVLFGVEKDDSEDMLEYFAQSPFIVRSSSFLEDGFGNAFAGVDEVVDVV